MNFSKNKIVVVLLLVGVVLFIVAYSLLTFGKKEASVVEEDWLPLPKMKDPPVQFTSKTAAVHEIKEDRVPAFPQLYEESLFDPLEEPLVENREQDLLDSLYLERTNGYAGQGRWRDRPALADSEAVPIREEQAAVLAEKQQQHRLFFATLPLPVDTTAQGEQETLYVQVDGTQTVQQNYRLRMRLARSAVVGGTTLPKNTLLYGFVSFRPQRALLRITHIGEQSVQYTAHDLADGHEGIYIENSVQQEAATEVTGGAINEVNMPGLPSVGGLKQLFRRRNRQAKVTIADHYQLILKPTS